jgi:sugar O-acyltransferase (sialic acid O-acetyltransferase NeuD family)
MAEERIAVLGAGGHAAVIVATLHAMGRKVEALFDDSPKNWGSTVLGVPIRGPIAAVRDSACTRGIIGVGDNHLRKRISHEIEMEWTTAVHPFSWVHPDVPLGPGSVVFAGGIVQAGARIGAHVILNTRASVDHHCRVGDYAHIAVAHLGGGASIGEGVFLALGSVVLPGLHVGDWAVVGAGAVVTRNVAPATTVVGVPARPIASQPRSQPPA